jgi:molecular chaperone DnaK (HSP70)
VGNRITIDSWTLGKEIFLDEIDYNDVDFERAFQSLFQYINRKIEKLYHMPVMEVVMIVPSSYATKDPRKNKITTACRTCGVKDISFVTADVAYCYYNVALSQEESVIVYNIGYNTTQISIVKRIGGELISVACKQIDGLGGRLFDSLIYQDLEQKVNIEYDEKFQLMQVKNIAELCKFIKEELSQTESVSLSIPYSSASYTLQRETFESMIKDEIELSLKETFNCINESNASLSDIKKIVFTGGSSMIPYIQKLMDLTFNIGVGSKKEIMYPSCATSAMYESCKGGLLIPNTGGILNI